MYPNYTGTSVVDDAVGKMPLLNSEYNVLSPFLVLFSTSTKYHFVS